MPDSRIVIGRPADCRYAGQGYEVRFDVPAGKIDNEWVEETRAAFHKAHDAEYGHKFQAEVEIINIRVVGIGLIDELKWPKIPPATTEIPIPLFTRAVTFEVNGRAKAFATPHYDRSVLGAGCPSRAGHHRAVRHHHGRSAECEVDVDKFGNLIIDCTRAISEKSADLADPIMMRVIGGAFHAIAKEMASVLYRMSYSSIIRESEDLGAGIFDSKGYGIAESNSAHVHGRDAEDRAEYH